MNRRQIDRFFDTLAREVEAPARAFITGAAAAALWGRVRPSVDIDFALDVRSRAADRWREVEQAVERATRLTGIPASFAQDIDRWGMITLGGAELDLEDTVRRFHRAARIPLPAQADRHQLATTRGTSNVGPTTIRSAAAQNTSSPWDSGGRPQASGSARSGKTTRRVLRPWRSSHATARPSRRHRGGASR